MIRLETTGQNSEWGDIDLLVFIDHLDGQAYLYWQTNPVLCGKLNEDIIIVVLYVPTFGGGNSFGKREGDAQK